MSPRLRRRCRPAPTSSISRTQPRARSALSRQRPSPRALPRIAGRAELSATVGDLPLEPAAVLSAVLATAATGVDYVKLGLFPGGDARGCLSLLAQEARGLRLMLVVFADAPPGFDAIDAASRIGASGRDARYRLQGWTLLARPPRSRRCCRFRGRSSCRRSSRGACRVAPSGRRAASASARARSSRLSRRALPGWRSRCSPRHISLCRDPGAHPPCAACRRECRRA